MPSRIGLALLACSLLLGSCGRETPPDIIVGPYLVRIAPHDATIVWMTSTPADSTVECWRGEALPPRHVDARTTAHEVHLSGLRPDTEYTYRVASGPARSPMLRFRTAPVVRRKFAFAVCGGISGSSEEQTKLAAAIGEHDPAFVVRIGPLGQEEAASAESFLTAARDLLSSRPIISSRGPGEADAAAFRRRFPTRSGSTWRAFRYLNVAVFALDLSGAVAPGDEQHRWLTHALARSDAQWKLVVLSPSLYPTDTARVAAPPRQTLCPLLIRAGADATISSGLGLYSRTRPLGSGEKPGDNAVVHFTTSATTRGTANPNLEPWMARADGAASFLLVEADEDLLTVRAIGLDDSVIETTELFKSDNVRSYKGAISSEAIEGLLAFLPGDGFAVAGAATPLTVTVTNPYDSPIDGLLRWRAAKGWGITPPTLKLDVPPLSQASYTLTVAPPAKAGAAPTPILVSGEKLFEAVRSPFRLPDTPK